MNRAILLISLMFFIPSVFACSGGVKHIGPYTPKKRRYQVGQYGNRGQPKEPGSLWVPGSRGLFEDARASRVGDIILIKIDEDAYAVKSSFTKTKRETSTEASADAFLGLLQKLATKYPDINLSKLISAGYKSEFKGDGSTGRKGKLEATIAVRITKIMPNGDFFVEGHKVILINDEENHLYVSGVIRPADVDSDNSVWSWRVADAQVEFTGRGTLTDNQRRGWLARLLDKVWPF